MLIISGQLSLATPARWGRAIPSEQLQRCPSHHLQRQNLLSPVCGFPIPPKILQIVAEMLVAQMRSVDWIGGIRECVVDLVI